MSSVSVSSVSVSFVSVSSVSVSSVSVSSSSVSVWSYRQVACDSSTGDGESVGGRRFPAG